MKIKVVTKSGQPLNQDVLIKRELLAKLAPGVAGSLVPVIGGLALVVYFIAAYLWPLWDAHKQTLMDLYADTVVVPA